MRTRCASQARTWRTARPCLEAYKGLASAVPKPKIDDALLEALRATQAFKDNEIVAK